MPSAPTLTDGVVTIRGHLPGDADGSFEQCQDPLSQRWTTVPVPYSRDDARVFVTEIMPGGWAEDTEWGFAIEVEGRYAGTVSLRNE
ncbi:MAG: GNAT family N-acetyltransferase, partial [Actinobacteria bacterium]|nr:GNAT family N-acetyltransferase [Actinomycetota bacterium]